MRQPTKPLPKLGNRSAVGPFEHADQHRALCARPRSISVSTGNVGSRQIGALRRGLGLWRLLPGDRVGFFSTMFFSMSMLSEAPSGATAAGTAAELVSVAADPERAFETRRRDARWRSRAGLFISPVSTFAPLFVCLRGCLLAIVFVLWIRIAHRDACTTTSP